MKPQMTLKQIPRFRLALKWERIQFTSSLLVYYVFYELRCFMHNLKRIKIDC